MAYTPTNWQTGDTITAEKLNNLENGVDNAQWKSEEPTQLFSETVTTEDDGGTNYGTLAYSGLITANSLTVTFNGTEYVCPRQEVIEVEYSFAYYGGWSENGADFSEYPFAILTSEESNDLATETAGTYTVSATGTVISYTQSFTDAITASTKKGTYKVTITQDNNRYTSDKTFAEVLEAINAGLYVYAVVISSHDINQMDFYHLDEVYVTDHIHFYSMYINGTSGVTKNILDMNITDNVVTLSYTYPS